MLAIALTLSLLANLAHPTPARAQTARATRAASSNTSDKVTIIQGPNAIRLQIQQKLQSQLNLLNGTLDGKNSHTRVEVGALDPRIANQSCDHIELILPAANRLRANIQIGVRCRSPRAWSAWVPATIRVNGTYYVAAHQLSPGKTLDMSDLEARAGDLSMLPISVVQQPTEAVGRVLLTSLAPNQPLRTESLRMPIIIQAGQTVKLVAEGSGFQVTSDGRALNQANAGQVAQVRTANGNVVSGIARSSGVVAIQF